MKIKSIDTSNEKYIFRQNVHTRLAPKTPRDSKKTGFTLIELLVVIAIIAMLLAIVVPALRMAKEKGALAVCLYNVRQLSTAWYSYQMENKGKLVNPNIGEDCWVMTPLRADGKTECPATADQTNPITDEDEQRGIEKGALFPYLKAYDVYHCPGDNLRKSRTDLTYIFRTYAIANCMNGKYDKITSPGIRYNFVEEADCRGYNNGTWDFKIPTAAAAAGAIDQGWRWQDPIGINHGDSGVLGFCDGHAESHKWVDSWTKDRVMVFFNSTETGYGTFEEKNFFGSRVQFNDLNYMGAGWADRSFPK
jgi:prepilin-type N-terminal cleavage/methylation domain-containing protein